ncbi:MAG: hypothetical protein V3S15_01295 [Woeseiaceae bacterium]
MAIVEYTPGGTVRNGDAPVVPNHQDGLPPGVTPADPSMFRAKPSEAAPVDVPRSQAAPELDQLKPGQLPKLIRKRLARLRAEIKSKRKHLAAIESEAAELSRMLKASKHTKLALVSPRIAGEK